MGKSTYEEGNKNHDLNKGAFPTFRILPSKILRIARSTPLTIFQIGQYFGQGWKRIWHYLLAVIVIFAIPYVGLDIYATVQLNYQLNLIRQKGEPLTYAEAAPPNIPDTQNAAILYEKAANSLQLKLKVKYATEDISPEEIATIIHKNETTIALIRQATARPKCRFNLDWGKNPAIALYSKETEPMHNLFRLLRLQVWDNAQKDNTIQALEDIHRMHIMVRHLSEEPLIPSSFTALRMNSEINETIAKVLSNSSVSPTQARTFEISLPKTDWHNVAYQFLLTERVRNIEQFQIDLPFSQWKGYNPFTTFPDTFIWYLEYAIKPLRKLDEAHALNLWQSILTNAKSTPISSMTDSGSRIQMKIRESPWYCLLTKITAEAFPRIKVPFDSAIVQRRQREIALALAAYHAQYHQYPTTLVPAEKLWKSTFPLDPYNSKPFRYKSDGKTFLLYSVGLNGKDDGGKWIPSGSPESDIVWGH